MVHHLQHIIDLVEICRLKGIQHVVVSPGSRNAPLIHQFASNGFFSLHSIVDERSAAFYGLGIAISKNLPVAILCTSGTAGLNFAPALAEAFYRHVPLVAITADRPAYLIGQQDNQTIRQSGMFRNFVKQSVHVEIPINSNDDLKHFHFEIGHVLNVAVTGIEGPVHINIPLEEPLYGEIPSISTNIGLDVPKKLLFDNTGELKSQWMKSQRRLIIIGQLDEADELGSVVRKMSDKGQVVVLAEPISNINGENFVAEIDRVMMHVELDQTDKFQPDLLISTGGYVVSKRLKNWLQKQNVPHFRISEELDGIDTYQNLTCNVTGNVALILSELSENEMSCLPEYAEAWRLAYEVTNKLHNRFFDEAPFSDLKAFWQIMKALPKGSVLHLGNSSPIRYGQLFDLKKFCAVYANRGVSGIDGCVSTAAGFASQSHKSNFLIIGDLGFMYDSNGLWNRDFPANLKVIVLNNSGGGIFRLLEGAASISGFESYMEAHTPVSFEFIAKAFGFSFYHALNSEELEKQLAGFLNSTEPSILEVKTPAMHNPDVYAHYIRTLKQL